MRLVGEWSEERKDLSSPALKSGRRKPEVVDGMVNERMTAVLDECERKQNKPATTQRMSPKTMCHELQILCSASGRNHGPVTTSSARPILDSIERILRLVGRVAQRILHRSGRQGCPATLTDLCVKYPWTTRPERYSAR